MRKPIISDEELVKNYLAGNEACLRTLLYRHKSRIYTSILVLVKEQYIADDIFQDTFLKAIDTMKRGKYNEEGKFLQWIMRIARNLVIDHFRRQSKTPVITDSEGNDVLSYICIPEDNREDEMVQEQTCDRIRSLIHHLPEEQREVLVLRHYAEMSFKDIADLTGVSINTALGRMRYALNNMRKLIERHQISL